jgi:hypothetical protein
MSDINTRKIGFDHAHPPLLDPPVDHTGCTLITTIEKQPHWTTQDWTTQEVVELSQGTGSGGKKDDGGKLRWSLLIQSYLTGIVRILEYGAKKYASHSWQVVPEGETRYYEALKRHLDAMQQDDGSIDLNSVDEESGMPHLWHLQTNAYFLEYFRRQECRT